MKHALKFLASALIVFSVGAQAAVYITIEERNGDVVVSGSGSINGVAGAIEVGNIPYTEDGLISSPALVGVGSLSVDTKLYFIDAVVPERFGTGSQTSTSTTNTGDPFVIGYVVTSEEGDHRPVLHLPANYIFGNPLTFNARFINESLHSLGLIAGVYHWSWGTAQDGDTVTLTIIPSAVAPVAASPVPTLGTWGLISLAAAIAAAGAAITRRRKPH